MRKKSRMAFILSSSRCGYWPARPAWSIKSRKIGRRPFRRPAGSALAGRQQPVCLSVLARMLRRHRPCPASMSVIAAASMPHANASYACDIGCARYRNIIKPAASDYFRTFAIYHRHFTGRCCPPSCFQVLLSAKQDGRLLSHFVAARAFTSLTSSRLANMAEDIAQAMR